MNWLLSILSWVVGKLFGNPSSQPPATIEGEKLGQAQADLAGAKQAAVTEAAIAQAEATAPSDTTATVVQLKAGTF